ncbi:Na+/H+ antiporter subunit B [Jannaschia rubra]|uniref:Multiple resistance and pH homeostasis protein B n=1 Tax=Jannaschia rubra TaxID=282197 RepID=A0A0M6XTZ0_9RHOB|nr:Na+/H+ antiporter subunit B [Jannaschia rubra]CTQ33661.1 Multiple resistance and pH homeostasis protein B [Jannaschia rubra]SFG05952.1 multisubunit sodium/proton antiporter, MrpB subunit [Jannaschia rubra]
MTSLIVRAATRVLVGLLLVFSIFMLLRGHNEPGGGFIGGLIGATGFILYAIAHGCAAARGALRADPRSIAVAGLGVALLAGVAGLLAGDAIFTGQWLFLGGAEGEKGLPLSTILLFDLGVYLVVLGAVLTIVFALEEEV